MLTERQERFCKEFIVDGNATAAYVRAGYASKGANALSARLIAKDSIRKRIDGLMAAKDEKLIAKGDEVLAYLTRVLRGEIGEKAIVVDEDGQHEVALPAKISDRNKAAELLGKRWALWTEKMDVSGIQPVIIDSIPRVAYDAEGGGGA